ncbi:hypothetical protein AJ79_06918 [Helicocarpus griseus UAMH5409]|uniref:Dienelactone hydrolase domain-containing protein n=1 Tax=Helicocarpus griseus UAMH5409 TaxID=1447875 RepID=A0A2B7X8C9_9EURO|nr:hypothetical protein AJ79_06918 [Helicocarpus griseus UAMH5409]
MAGDSCCCRTFDWGGKPAGTEKVYGNVTTYVTGHTSNKAVLVVHDLLGWEYVNLRLLADHYAREVGATVFIPDFFHGSKLAKGDVLSDDFDKDELDSFLKKNSPEKSVSEALPLAENIRKKYKRLGAVGFGYGGWVVFMLGRKGAVDCASVAYPLFMEGYKHDEYKAPLQILAPEQDSEYTVELKKLTFDSFIRSNLDFQYLNFPDTTHGSLAYDDPENRTERQSLVRAKIAVVRWLREFLVEKEIDVGKPSTSTSLSCV